LEKTKKKKKTCACFCHMTNQSHVTRNWGENHIRQYLFSCLVSVFSAFIMLLFGFYLLIMMLQRNPEFT